MKRKDLKQRASCAQPCWNPHCVVDVRLATEGSAGVSERYVEEVRKSITLQTQHKLALQQDTRGKCGLSSLRVGIDSSKWFQSSEGHWSLDSECGIFLSLF